MPTWRRPSAVAVRPRGSPGLALGLVDLLLLVGLGLLDDALLVAFGRVDLGVALAFEVSTTARFSRSARICFSIAESTSFGGVMFLIS